MKKYLLALALLVISASLVQGQKLEKSALIGTWTVVKVTNTSEKLTADEKQIMEVLKRGYLLSNFNFQANGKFTIKFQEGAPALMKQMNFLNNKDWKFNDKEQLVSVGTKEDNYNHLRMYVMEKGERVLFAFNDTPLILEMIKK